MIVMTIEEMQERKRELGYSYEKLAEISGIPLGTRAENSGRYHEDSAL